jgi:hypothetical protein
MNNLSQCKRATGREVSGASPLPSPESRPKNQPVAAPFFVMRQEEGAPAPLIQSAALARP